LATVLFTDVVDSTTQLARSGDQVWARLLDALDAVTRSEVRRRGGDVVKSTGDGALMLLPSPTAAVECAAALHGAAIQLGVALRIGGHTGEIERRGLDVAGIAVHVAARLMGCAGSGETVVSATVRTLASSASELFEELGELDLKGVPDPVRAFMVRRAEVPAPSPPVVATDVGTATRLIRDGRFEEAAEVAPEIDPGPLADALVAARGRAEFLDVDITLVRMLEELLDRLPESDAIRRSRIAAKLAFELRGDPATAPDRRDLLDLAARLAENANDDYATSEALLATIHSLWEPAGATDRLSAADRVIVLARQTHSIEHELEARLARVHALVERWQVHEAGLELATYARLAARLDRPDVNVFVASRRAMLAQISGRYDEQLRQGEIAYTNALAAGMPDAERLRMAHRWPNERDCGTSTELFEAGVEMLRELARLMPGNYYEADVARALLVLGRTSEARTELARALPPLLTSFGYRWLFAAIQAAEVAAAVGPDDVCERLYDLLLPHQDRLVSLGPNFAGAVGDRLGILALRLGRVEEAVHHVRRTVEELDRIAALPWVARARAHLAAALRAAGDSAGSDRELRQAQVIARDLGMSRFLAEIGGADEHEVTWSLRRDGADWILEAGLERARLRPTRGLEHLAVLVANPGKDIPALKLDAPDTLLPTQPGVPTLDAQAAREYRRRLSQIDDEQDAADRSGDQRAAQRLVEEREFLLGELRRATGLGGRVRSTGGAVERARVNVTRYVTRAIDEVRLGAPIAGEHLASSIRTGSECRYSPAPNGPAAWRVEEHEGVLDS
jgi:tetratricopeptide (TPR) repeat protein